MLFQDLKFNIEGRYDADLEGMDSTHFLANAPDGFHVTV